MKVTDNILAMAFIYALVIALETMARRIDLLDMRVFVSTVAVFQKSGGNLPLLLDRVAAGARDRNQFRGHLRSVTALGRVASLAIAAAPPVFLMVYLLARPEYTVAFFRSPVGWAIVAGAMLVELIGLLWIFRVLKIEY